ncbi:MAG: prepilin-type N-terminal cleavage/methylation domain-containing protein, partial [Vibrio sp.]
MNRMQGFSLIEGLIASVLLSLLVQIMLTLGVVLTKYQRQIEAKQAMVFEAQRYLALAQVSAQSIHHNDASHLEQILMQAFKNLTLQSDLPKVE